MSENEYREVKLIIQPPALFENDPLPPLMEMMIKLPEQQNQMEWFLAHGWSIAQ